MKIYNSYTRSLEKLEPINPPFVGLYVCGPTVYGPPHLGHVRGPITFDVLRRYLDYKGYKTRHVRNITDVGHLVGDGDEGEDKLQKQAKLEQIEPMQIAHNYTEQYNHCMRLVNVLSPHIEPHASGHILEQIEMIEAILEKNMAYEVNGNVYFDVANYAKTNDYGKLSGRVLEDLISGAGNAARELEGQEIKRNAADFALWKKADESHIMQWSSPWGKGYPGWHIECSAMSNKYLGKQFDIHGGGMDLLFPHHEAEIAQSHVACGHNPAKVWMHHNMITINGQKMAKSLGNGITVEQLFDGTHPLLNKAYSPMTLRFFVLQAHYRGTLDFSNDALQAAEKGLKRLLEAAKTANQLKPSNSNTYHVADIENAIIAALDEDLNTPIAIAQLFEAARVANLTQAGELKLDAENTRLLQSIFSTYLTAILGFEPEQTDNNNLVDGLIKMLLNMRAQAKANKDFATSDEIRDKLVALGVQVKDTREGSSYTL